MEAIKVNVNVTVDFSESVRAFITGLFTAQNSTPAKSLAQEVPATTPAKSMAQEVPATTPATAKPAAPAAKPAAPAAKPAAPAAPAATISIDEVRALLSNKVNTHREEIKNKLAELGSPSVTKLDPSKYGEMITFLNSLS